MSSFGTSGLFLCYVITMLFLTIVFGWPALVILILVAIGYAILLNGLNDRFYPKAKRGDGVGGEDDECRICRAF